MESEEVEYNIGDIIKNNITNKYYVIADYEYKNTSKFYTIKDLSSGKIITHEYLNSIHLVWNNGNFNGYEKEYRLASEAEAISSFRKYKINNLLNLDNNDNGDI